MLSNDIEAPVMVCFHASPDICIASYCCQCLACIIRGSKVQIGCLKQCPLNKKKGGKVAAVASGSAPKEDDASEEDF
jgi:hypothetical protein